MAILASGVSVLGRQILIAPVPDRTVALYLPNFGATNFEKTGVIEIFRLSSQIPTGRAQRGVIPIYVDSTFVDMPSDWTSTNSRLGAIWYRSGIPWEVWD